MKTFSIFDFEDGLQDYFGNLLSIRYYPMTWDYNGHFSFKFLLPSDKNIVIASKPYDCLERATRNGKYNADDHKSMLTWSRRNWRYTTKNIYNEISSYIDKLDDVYIIHPDSLVRNPEEIDKLYKYIGKDPSDFDMDSYLKFYKSDVNIR